MTRAIALGGIKPTPKPRKKRKKREDHFTRLSRLSVQPPPPQKSLKDRVQEMRAQYESFGPGVSGYYARRRATEVHMGRQEMDELQEYIRVRWMEDASIKIEAGQGGQQYVRWLGLRVRLAPEQSFLQVQ